MLRRHGHEADLRRIRGRYAGLNTDRYVRVRCPLSSADPLESSRVRFERTAYAYTARSTRCVWVCCLYKSVLGIFCSTKSSFICHSANRTLMPRRALVTWEWPAAAIGWARSRDPSCPGSWRLGSDYLISSFDIEKVCRVSLRDNRSKQMCKCYSEQKNF